MHFPSDIKATTPSGMNNPSFAMHHHHNYFAFILQGSNYLFLSAVVKSYLFATLFWVNKDENMWSNKIFLPIGKYISHSCWKQIHWLKLYVLRPKQDLFLFEFSNNNSKIKCEICSKLTIEATDVINNRRC